jgi:hypothetical protein
MARRRDHRAWLAAIGASLSLAFGIAALQRFTAFTNSRPLSLPPTKTRAWSHAQVLLGALPRCRTSRTQADGGRVTRAEFCRDILLAVLFYKTPLSI